MTFESKSDYAAAEYLDENNVPSYLSSDGPLFFTPAIRQVDDLGRIKTKGVTHMSYYDKEIARLEIELDQAVKLMNSLTEWSDEWFAATDRVAELNDELWLRRNYSI